MGSDSSQAKVQSLHSLQTGLTPDMEKTTRNQGLQLDTHTVHVTFVLWLDTYVQGWGMSHFAIHKLFCLLL